MIKKYKNPIILCTILFLMLSIFISSGLGLTINPNLINSIIVTFFIFLFWLSLKNRGHMINQTPSIKPREVLLITIIIVTAFSLRLNNITLFEPYTDEYNHLIAVHRLLEGTSITDVYQRGLFIVTIPVYIISNIFGEGLLIARITGITINTLGIIPLYFLVRKINKPAAIFSIALYSINPWIIAVSQNVREYAYFPPLIFLFTYFIASIIEHLNRNNDVKKTLKKYLRPKNIINPLFILAIHFYMFFVDTSSTIRIATLIPLASIAALASTNNWGKKWVKHLLFIIFLLAIILFLILGSKNGAFSTLPEISDNWLKMLFYPAVQQSYFSKEIIILPIFALGVLWSLTSKNITAKLVAITFVVNLYIFTFHFARYFRPRYGSSIELWYLIILGIGFSFLYRLAKRRLGKKISTIIVALIFILCSNAQHIITIHQKSSRHPVTDEVHDQLLSTKNYIEKNMNEDDILIGTIYVYYHELYSQKKFSSSHLYVYKDKNVKTKTLKLIQDNESGWLIIDERRNVNGIPKKDFVTKDREVFLDRVIDDQYVYRW